MPKRLNDVCEEDHLDVHKVRAVQASMVGGLEATRMAEAFKGLSDPNRVRMVSTRTSADDLHAAGLKVVVYTEAFGTCHCYIAQLKRAADGSWVKHDGVPDLTRVFLNHWGWQLFDGTGEIRWLGVHNYYDNEDFARPYTRTHPRYGAPPLAYPDGTPAAGHNGAAGDPRNSRVLDAACSKDVLGRVGFDYGFNPTVNAPDPATGQPKGPLTGLLAAEDKYSGSVNPGKDAACPAWIDYTRASALQALDAGVDGFWCDNYSPWDSFGNAPVTRAFGEWSVAGFRRYLAESFSPAELRALGVGDPETFDVRAYLRARCQALGGEPEDLRSRAWRDAPWLDDPLWRAYCIYKRQTGTQALSAYYRAIKQAAAEAGKPEPLVCGNDIPIFSLGWPRGDLDMVSTEISWGWGLTTGSRGVMPPPTGSWVPLYKLGREHARSRFVNLWMYMPDEQLHKPRIAEVLLYQGLANHAFAMPQPGGNKTTGDDDVNSAFFGFVGSIRDALGARVPVEEIGLYYSSSSQLARMTPGGTLDFNNQPHIFAHWGWGTALCHLHQQYRAVPEWKLNRDVLNGLRLLIIPEAEVLDPADVPALAQWVGEGGALIVTGDSGRRLGELHNFDPNPDGLSLQALTGVADLAGAPETRRREVGKGVVVYLRQDPGLTYYLADAEREGLLPRLREALETAAIEGATPAIAQADGVPGDVGLTVYQDAAAQRLFLDVNNTRVDVATDALTPTPELSFTARLPEFLRGRGLKARVLSPGQAPSLAVTPRGEDQLDVSLGPVELYACVVVEPAEAG